jgi:UDP-N-acetylglucosamine 4,6-dehydratase
MSILITGGTGAFGKAYVQKLLHNNIYKRICIYSRDEWKQAQMRMKFNGDERLRFFIGDVRDKERLRQAMEGVSTVVHAAALKRVEVCEYDAVEMTKTNVMGAINVIEASYGAGVKRVVALSSDKACQPVNAYGASKLLSEKLFISANHTYGEHGPRYSCVRYGNVWKSTGSVVPIWQEIINNNLKKTPMVIDHIVPVTNPECTRYFMYLHEACDLVQSTINTMQGGEIVIPELPAYRLADLAEAMDVDMDVIGLEPREKQHETMDGITDSSQARRMTVEELREALKHE